MGTAYRKPDSAAGYGSNPRSQNKNTPPEPFVIYYVPSPPIQKGYKTIEESESLAKARDVDGGGQDGGEGRGEHGGAEASGEKERE